MLAVIRLAMFLQSYSWQRPCVEVWWMVLVKLAKNKKGGSNLASITYDMILFDQEKPCIALNKNIRKMY